MKLNTYLVITSGGSVRALKSKPSLSANEISLHLNINLPDALFRKPALQASITIPDEAASPQVIESSVVENVREAIHQATGLEVQLKLISEEEF